MKVNTDKSHLLMSGKKAITNIGNKRMKSEDIYKILEITIESKLTFETHINKFFKTGS